MAMMLACKAAAAPLWSAEMDGVYSKLIRKQSEALVAAGYEAQVFPREINLFDLRDGAVNDLSKPTTIVRIIISVRML